MPDIAIPASCAQRPTIGGVVAPYVNIRLADGGVDFRSPHHATYEKCWTRNLCQVCGNRTGHPAVLFGGPNQVATGRFDEPPLCVACAQYASRACPMVAGQLPRYADRARLSEGRRGQTCPDPTCHCGGYTPADPNRPGENGGDPAHPWYAVFIDPTAYQVTAHQATIRCTDRGCEHQRLIVNGGQLTAQPLKVVLVSTQETGRIWRRLTPDEWPTETCNRSTPTDPGGAPTRHHPATH